MSKWNPIQSAPYDTPILITWRNDRGTRSVTHGVLNLTTIDSKAQFMSSGNGNRIVSYWTNDIDGEVLDIEPDYWIHMPNPPNDA